MSSPNRLKTQYWSQIGRRQELLSDSRNLRWLRAPLGSKSGLLPNRRAAEPKDFSLKNLDRAGMVRGAPVRAGFHDG